jgi:TIR domain
MTSALLQYPYVFISYSRFEEAFAKRLEQDLRAHGLRIWRDETDINPGSSDWEAAMRNAISHAYAVVLIASPRVITSLYIKGELNLAKRYHPKRIYPVWIDGTDWSDCVPIDFINTQYIDMRQEKYETGLNTLVRVLKTAEASSGQDTAIDQQDIVKRQDVPYFPPSGLTPGLVNTRTHSFTSSTLIVLICVIITAGLIGGAYYLHSFSSPSGISSRTPTATPSLVPSLTPTSTPSPQAIYTQITSGNPTFTDSLQAQDQYNWSEDTECSFSNGAYTINVPSSFFAWCIEQQKQWSNFLYQAQITIVTGSYGGIIFRENYASGVFYHFYIGQDGSYKLYLDQGNKGHQGELLRSGRSSTINMGLNQANLLAVLARGSNLYLYINQKFITSVSDGASLSGLIGVIALPNGNPTEVLASNLQIWDI